MQGSNYIRIKIVIITAAIILLTLWIGQLTYSYDYVNKNGLSSDEIDNEDDSYYDDEDYEDDEGDEEGGSSSDANTGPGVNIVPGELDSETLVTFEKINNKDVWVGWRKYHYNHAISTRAVRGGEVKYKYKEINTVSGYEIEKEGSGTSKGYGLYSLDYNKHILGYLHYAKNKGELNKDTKYELKGHEEESDETQEESAATGNGDDKKVTIKDIYSTVAEEVLSTFYNKKYEEEVFKDFWINCIPSDLTNVFSKLQNEFYYKAYAQNAINKLKKMNFPFNSIKSHEKAAIHGMIFSIMEARYRDKNVNGKTNLEIKVDEGDLWPFLMNIGNLDKIVYNKITKKYEDTTKGEEYYAWPSMDDIVDGCYQWMYYYESKFETSTSANTVSSNIIQGEPDEEVDEQDWEGEYKELTNEEEFPYLDGNKLQKFYERVTQVRSLFKKSKSNTEGIFGAEELYDITSEVSYSEAMDRMREAMANLGQGKELKLVWKGLDIANIARTYMMARNIMENEKVQSEYAYYNIGTNVISATPGLHGSEYLLIDFERVNLKKPLYVRDKDNQKTIPTYEDTDDDGLYDGNELNEGQFYDITSFVEKMVLSELYGSNYKIVSEEEKERKEKERKEKEGSEGQSIVYITNKEVANIMTNFKKNLIKQRKAEEENNTSMDSILSDASIVDPNEYAENYLNCFSLKDTDGTMYASQEEAATARLKVKLYKFVSNPIFKDTDFDGVPDGKGSEELKILKNVYGVNEYGKVNVANYYDMLKLDKEPQNNIVSGDMMTTSNKVGTTLWIFGEKAQTHMDYRYFFMNNKNYYDELSTMSIMLCNTLEHNENSGSGDLANLTTLFKKIGLKKWHDESEVEIKTATYGTNGEVKYIVGENDIEYTHNDNEKPISKKVKLIVVKSIEYGKDNIEKIGKDPENINSHELFAGLAKAIYDKEFKGQEYCYWITGYNTGGAVANVLAAKMIDNGLYYVPRGNDIHIDNSAYTMFDKDKQSTQLSHSKVISNVYCYTYGAPYTVYNGDEIENEENTIASKYASIFNVVNNSDIYAHIMPNKYKWGRYGATCYKAVKVKNIAAASSINKAQAYKEMRLHIENKIKQIFDSYETPNNFKDNYTKKLANTTHEELINQILDNLNKNQTIDISITEKIKANPIIKSNYISLIETINASKKFINDQKDESIYYTLSKQILPEDISFIVNTEFNRLTSNEESIYSRFPCFQLLKGIELIGDVEIPMMFQSYEIWDNFKFGKNKETTIRPGGCSITSLAMVLSWITKKEITPPDVRNMLDNQKTHNYLDGNKNFKHSAMSEIPDFFNVVNLAVEDGKSNDSYDSFNDEDTVLYYLKKGKPIITRTDGGYLKTRGHFFVIAGIGKYDKNGNEITNIDTANKDDLLIYICDPKYTNQEKNSVCIKAFTFDQIMGSGSDDLQATRFWVFDVDESHKGEFAYKDGSDYIYEFNDVQCTSINKKYVDEYRDVLGKKEWKMP